MGLNAELERALAAIKAGAPPDAVKNLFMERTGVPAEQIGSMFQDITDDMKQDYRDIVVPSVIQEDRLNANYVPYAPRWDEAIASAKFEEEPGPPTLYSNLQGAADEVAAGLLRGGRAATGLAAGAMPALLGSYPNFLRETQDQLFSLGDALGQGAANLQKTGNVSGWLPEGQQAPNASENARFIGLLGGELATGGLSNIFNAPADVLQKGEGLPSAYGELAEQTVLAEAQTALGLPFKSASGLYGAAKRFLTQAPGGAALTAADAALRGQDFTARDAAAAVALGGLGALAREPTRAELDVNLGKEAGQQLLEEADTIRKGYNFTEAAKRQQELIEGRTRLSPEQGDLFTSEPLVGDLFGAEPVPASTAESRRAIAADKEAPSRTALDQTELERQYIFDQQERLARAAEEAALTPPEGFESVPSRPAQADLGNLGVAPAEEGTLANTAMRDAFREAQLRRYGGTIDIAPEVPGPATRNIYDVAHGTERGAEAGASEGSADVPSVFEPARNETVEQPAPEQGQLPVEPNDLFASQAEPTPTAYIPATEAAASKKIAADAAKATAVSRLAELSAKAKRGVLSAEERAERDWLTKNKNNPEALTAVKDVDNEPTAEQLLKQLDNSGAVLPSWASETARPKARANRVDVDDGSVETAGLRPTQRTSPKIVKEARRLWLELGTRSPFFKKWYGDWENGKPSGPLDAEGQPQVFYHGTRSTNDKGEPINFTVFQPHRGDFGTHAGTPEQADDFVMGPDNPAAALKVKGKLADDDPRVKADRILPIYLRAKNPLRLPDTLWGNSHVMLQDIKQAAAKLPSEENFRLLRAVDELETDAALRAIPIGHKEIAAALEKAGYDSIVYKNTAEGRKDSHGEVIPEDSYIVFRPEQIKSTGNRGTFSGPDILKADGSTPSIGIAPASVREALAAGTLTGKQTLDALINNEGGMFSNAKEARAWASHLSKLLDRFGGGEVVLRNYNPNNPIFAEALKADPALENAGGFFDPATKTIWINPIMRGKMSNLVHEVGHAILHNIIFAGENRVLDGPAQEAFNRLTLLKDIVDKQAEVGWASWLDEKVKSGEVSAEQAAAIAKKRKPYGLTDLHEMYSEMYSNQMFRDFLRNMPVPEEVSRQIIGGRTTIGKIRNMYQAVLAATARLFKLSDGSRAAMGLSDREATNALDLMFSAGQDVFNATGPVEATFRFDGSGTVDFSFFPNQGVESGPVINNPSFIKEKSSTITAIAKNLLASGGGKDAPIREAEAFLRGETTAGLYATQTDAQSWLSNIKKLPQATRAKAEEWYGAIVNDAASKEAEQGFNNLQKLNPEMAAVAARFAATRFAQAKQIVSLIRAMPNPTKEQLQLAVTIDQQANTYAKRAYKNRKEMKQQYKEAKKAQAKLAAGGTLTLKEADLLNKRNAAITSVRDSFLSQPKATMEGLSEQYRLLTKLNPEEQFAGVDRATKRELMEGAINKQLASITDMDSYAAQLLDVMSGMSKDRADAVGKYYKGLRMGSNILSRRAAVSPEMRAWWGEIVTPSAQAYTTLVNQTHHLAALGALDLLAKTGTETGLFTRALDDPKRTAAITGSKFGPLQGLHTTPEAKRAIDSVFDANSMFSSVVDGIITDPDAVNFFLRAAGAAVRGVSKLTSATKTMGVVYNPGSWVRNVIGSPMQLAASGNTDLLSYGKGVSQMAKAIGLEFRTQVSPETQRNLRLGLLEASQTNETYGPQSRAIIANLIKASDGNPTTLMKGLQEAVKEWSAKGETGLVVVKELYGAMDLWTKLANFEYNLDFRRKNFAKRGIHMPEDALERYVADLTNDTNITPSRAPKIVKASEQVGTTRYASYYTEVARTIKNNFKVGAMDLMEGAKLGDSDLMWHGAKRILGSAGAVGYANSLFSAGVKTVAGLMGLSMTEPEEKQGEFLEKATFAKGGDPLTWKDGDTTYYYDVGQIGPYDPVWRIGKAAGQVVAKPEKWQEGMLGVWESIADLGNSNALITNSLKAIAGKQPSLAKRDPEGYKNLLQKFADVGVGKDIADRVINILQLGPKTAFEIPRGIHEREASTGTRIAIGSGIGIERLAPTQTLANYLGGRFKAELADARKDFTSLIKSPVATTPEAIEGEFVEAMQDIVKPYARLKAAVDAAREQGTPDREIAMSLKEGRVPMAVTGMLLSGKAFPVGIVFTDLKASAEQDVLRAMREGGSAEETAQKWHDNLSALGRIASKYSGMTIEDVMNGELN